MVGAFAAVSAVVPSILLAWYFKARDLNPEPGRVLWATFGLGVLTIPFVVAVAAPIDWLIEHFISNPLLAGTAEAFATAAMPEEAAKLLVVWLYASRHRDFDEPMDGIVYGAIASLGFATLENVLYVMQGGVGLAIARALTAVPAHAFWGAIMGYFVGQMRFGKRRGAGWLVAAWFWPMLLHGLYDTPLLALRRLGPEPPAALGLTAMLCAAAMVVVSWVWAVRLVRRLRRDQETEARTPPAAERKNVVLGLFLLLGGGGLASLGGLVLLGTLLAVIVGAEGEELALGLVGAAVMGGLPLGLGGVLFWLGLRWMPKRDRGKA